MSIVLRRRYLEDREVYGIMCSRCGDVYKYYPKHNEEDTWFLCNYQTCLACNKLYAPCINIKVMDEFVFDAMKRCKM